LKASEEEIIDIHKILTTLFNVHLNEFIAKFSVGAVFERAQTGGFYEVGIKKHHRFKTYVDFLESFRDDLYYSTYPTYRLRLKDFRKAMDSLLSFYAVLELFRSEFLRDDELIEIFFKPFRAFIASLDRDLNTAFAERIEEFQRSIPKLTVGVINRFGIPMPSVEVEVSWIVRPEFGNYSKRILLAEISTDDLGKAKIKLSRGHYQVDVRKYKKMVLVDLNDNKDIIVKVSDLRHLIKHFIKRLTGSEPKGPHIEDREDNGRFSVN